MTEDFVKQSLKNYEEVLERVENVFKILEVTQDVREYVSNIDFNEHCEDEEVFVTTSYTSWNETVENFYQFPIRYLWMDDVDILREVHKKKEEEREREIERKRRIEEEVEEHDRKEYERLKKKYGN